MQTLPQNLMVCSDGCLYDTSQPGWADLPIRRNYRYTHREINTVADLKATLRNGSYTWPGGYPLFFITSDGAALSFESVTDNMESVVWSIRNNCSDGWRVVTCDINWEDTFLIDDHSGEPIESAYGEDE